RPSAITSSAGTVPDRALELTCSPWRWTIQVEVHFKSRDRHAGPVWSHSYWRVGSAHRPGELGAPLLRTSGTPVTNRAGGRTTALRFRERRARGLDPTLPGRWVHASRDPRAADGLEPTEPPVGPACER